MNRTGWICAWLGTLLLITCLPGIAIAQGTVIVFGGKTLPEDGLAALVTLAGGENGRIAIAPFAGTPADEVEAVATALRDQGAGEVRILPSDTAAVHGANAAAPLQGINAVVFSDGDPVRLARVLKGSAFGRAMRSHLSSGGVIAGIGLASGAFSETMLVPSPGTPPAIREGRFSENGLGWIASTVIAPGIGYDGRLRQLAAVAMENAWLLGIGIEDATAIAVRQGVMDVFGRGSVVVFDPIQASVQTRDVDGAISARGVVTYNLLAGEAFHVTRRAPLARPW